MRIARALNYTLEGVLDHTIDWFNEINTELARQELDDKLFQMALHGVKQQYIDKARNDFERRNRKDKEKMENIFIPIERLKIYGLKVGKPSKTKITRGKSG